MSALTTMLQIPELEPVVENVFIDSCCDLVSCFSEDSEQYAAISEYVSLISNKQLKRGLEQEISEALTSIMEYNANLYSTFLLESYSDDSLTIDESVNLLGVLRERFGTELVVEALSERAKKYAKIGAGVAGGLGAAGLGAYGVYKAGDGNFGAGLKKIGNTVKGVFNKEEKHKFPSDKLTAQQAIKDNKWNTNLLRHNAAKAARNRVGDGSDLPAGVHGPL